MCKLTLIDLHRRDVVYCSEVSQRCCLYLWHFGELDSSWLSHKEAQPQLKSLVTIYFFSVSHQMWVWLLQWATTSPNAPVSCSFTPLPPVVSPHFRLCSCSELWPFHFLLLLLVTFLELLSVFIGCTQSELHLLRASAEYVNISGRWINEKQKILECFSSVWSRL